MFVEGSVDIPSRIAAAIQNAAKATGAQFDYLLKTAIRESNLDPNAKASSSSATGLFQFIDQTWLGTLKDAGPALGYGRYADAIEKTAGGRYQVQDPTMRREVMQLRFNPEANAAMGGAFTQRNRAELRDGIGREPSPGELYIAHFLGASGAVKMITRLEQQPQAKAADLFPNAARANRSLFYDRAGQARSLAQTYRVLVAKHETEGASGPRPLVPGVDFAQIAQTAGREELRNPAGKQPAPVRASGPVFHALFRSGGEAIAPNVQRIWGSARVEHQQAVAAVDPSRGASSAGEGKIGGPLDLFQFLRPHLRSQAAPLKSA